MTDSKLPFNYCHRVDLHASQMSNLRDVVAVANEHAFRGVVVPHNQIESLTKEIQFHENSTVLPIATIDYPFGSLSSDVRTYAIISAANKGAKEVEIVAPTSLILNKELKKLDKDLENIILTCAKVKVGFKYIVDYRQFKAFSASIQSRILRMISTNEVPIVSTSLGIWDLSDDVIIDEVMWVKDVKKKTSAKIKTHVQTSDVNKLAQFPKVGSEILGVHWQDAPNIVHRYEEIISNS